MFGKKTTSPKLTSLVASMVVNEIRKDDTQRGFSMVQQIAIQSANDNERANLAHMSSAQRMAHYRKINS